MKKIKGEALITLKNAKTGKTEIQRKQNIITNLPNKFLEYIPMEMRERFPSVLEIFGGMLLFSNTNTVDADNYKLTQRPIGWSGLDINSISDSGKGVLVESECSIDEANNKIVITHEWGTSQANGTIASISLTNPCAWISSKPLIPFFNASNISETEYKNATNTTSTRLKSFSDMHRIPYYIDAENDLIYTVYSDKNDFSSLVFEVYSMGIKHRKLWGAQMPQWTNLTNYQNLQNNYAFKKSTFTINLSSPLYDSSWARFYYVNSLTYDKTNNILYIIQMHENNTQAVKIFKITNPLTSPSASEINLDLSNIFSANQVLGNGLNPYTYINGNLTASTDSSVIFTNAIPMKDNYIYLQTQGVKLLKINITDLSDFRIIDQSIHYDYNSMINDGNLCYGRVTSNYNYTVNVVVDMINDEIEITTGLSGGLYVNPAASAATTYDNHYHAGSDSFQYCFINDAYILETQSGYIYSSLSVYNRLLLNPAYMATINNLSTPILKTSAQTLTITYTLQEVEEPEEENGNENINLGD
jgi:hypothetical protein